MKKKNFSKHNFIENFNLENRLSGHVTSQKKILGSIGLAVLAVTGHKQTDNETNQQAKLIYRFDRGVTEKGRNNRKGNETLNIQ